ncbi:hypothetical protein SLS58_009225, partial [Diplodia intermedia]
MTSAIETLLKELNDAAGKRHDDALPESARVAALQAAKKLVTALQKPEDTLLEHAFGIATNMAVRIGDQLGLFPMLSEKEETSAQELASRTKADEELIGTQSLRIYRAFQTALPEGEHGNDTIRVGGIRYSGECFVLMGKYRFDLGLPAVAHACDWLKERNHPNPTDGANGPFQGAFQTDLPIFGWLQKHPRFADDVNTFFEGDRGSRPSWVKWFPVEEKLLQGSRADAPLLVDFAGGRGHDIVQFRAHFPDQPGRLVLQDQQDVLDSSVPLHPSIEKRSFDFFKEKPVPGARIYFLKFVLHDWSDEVCLHILGHVKEAMEEGYSLFAVSPAAVSGMKVAVTSLSALTAELHLFTNYNGDSRQFKPYQHVRPDSIHKEILIKEA